VCVGSAYWWCVFVVSICASCVVCICGVFAVCICGAVLSGAYGVCICRVYL